MNTEVKAYMEELGGTQEGLVNDYWRIDTLIVSPAIAVFFYNATRKAKVEVLEVVREKGPRTKDISAHGGASNRGYNEAVKHLGQAIDQLIERIKKGIDYEMV